MKNKRNKKKQSTHHLRGQHADVNGFRQSPFRSVLRAAHPAHQPRLQLLVRGVMPLGVMRAEALEREERVGGHDLAKGVVKELGEGARGGVSTYVGRQEHTNSARKNVTETAQETAEQ